MAIKVLVGCPTSEHKEYCLGEYIKGIRALTYPYVDILLVENSKDNVYFEKLSKLFPTIKGPWNDGARQRIVDSRNILRKKVLNGDYDYFFSLEQDIVPPKDAIERLLSHGKKIISGIYYKPVKMTDKEGRPANPFGIIDNQGKPASEINTSLKHNRLTLHKTHTRKVLHHNSSFMEI